MFERLKRLFHRRAPEPSEPELKRPFADRQAQARQPAVVSPDSDAPPTTAAPTPSIPADKDCIQVSLRAVILKLPETLKGKTKQPPAAGVRISIPAGKVLPQLPQGTVRISFGELRKVSPPGTFSDAPDRDHTLVDLPLQEILQQLRPDQLPRRLRQKRVEVPDEVVPIFTSQRAQNNVRISKSTAPEPPRSKSEALPSTPSGRAGSSSSPPTITPSIPLPMPSALRAPSAPQQPPPLKPSAPPHSHAIPKAPAMAPRTEATPRPVKPAPSVAIAPAAPPKAAPAIPAPTTSPSSFAPGDFISVPLAAITTGWPEPIRNALAGLNAPDATLQLPAAETEQALRRGKVVFPWKRLKPLVRPPLKTALSPALDDLQLELPLSTIAPLFMAQRKSGPAQRKYDVGEDIPDVFKGRGLAADHAPAPAPSPSVKSTSAPPATTVKPPASAPGLSAMAPIPMPTAAAPVSPAPDSTPTPVTPPTTLKTSVPEPPPVAAAPAPVAAAPVTAAVGQETSDLRDIGDVFGQPGRKNWAPAEIAQRTAKLKGVTGAVITMQDGLLIAAQLPAGLNGETIAAFLPQMFTRMMQYSKELKFGETDNITFILNQVPLRIYRVGSVYFAALGSAQESLPETPLRLIASHLGPQSK